MKRLLTSALIVCGAVLVSAYAANVRAQDATDPERESGALARPYGRPRVSPAGRALDPTGPFGEAAVTPYTRKPTPVVKVKEGEGLPSIGFVADKAAAPQAPEDQAKLREQLLELVKAQAEMMTTDELHAAIKMAQKQNDRLQAQRDLERATTILREIVDKHPNTPAGEAALRAHKALSPRLSNSFLPEPEPFGEFKEPQPANPDPFGGFGENEADPPEPF